MRLKWFTIMMVIVGILITSCGTKSPAQIERENRMLNSPQYKDGKFVNPIDVPMMAPGSTWKYIKKQFFTSRIDPKPKGELPLKPIQSNEWIGLEKSNLFFAWLGHSSILIALDGKTILVDPILKKRASPVSWIGPKRFHPPPVIAKDLPPIDVVLITHDHYDHLEKTTVKQLKDKTGLFLVPLGMGKLLEDWGITPENRIIRRHVEASSHDTGRGCPAASGSWWRHPGAVALGHFRPGPAPLV